MVLAVFAADNRVADQVHTVLCRESIAEVRPKASSERSRVYDLCTREDFSLAYSPGSIQVILGTPEYNGVSAVDGNQSENLPWLLNGREALIDSSFLIIKISTDSGHFEIVSDRYGSRPLFWTQCPAFLAVSTDVSLLYTLARQFSENKIDKYAVFEFLWFRRLFGEKTYSEAVRAFCPATHYFGCDGALSAEQRYWVPTPSGGNGSKKFWAIEIAEAISDSVNASIKRGPRVGLMLSAGLDSRALLAVGRDRFATFTNTPFPNQESDIARKLAESVGASNMHITRLADYSDSILDQAIIASNGMTQYYESQFLGYAKFLKQHVDRVQLGLFLDIFFCGHYMPKYHRAFFNRQTVHFVLSKVSDAALIDRFISTVSYRQKQTDLSHVLIEPFFSHAKKHMYEEIGALANDGHARGFRGVELWEYLHLTNVGRHYSMLMASSLASQLPVDLPALTIRNYDLAFALHPKWKVNWDVYLRALGYLGPDLMKFRNGNLNFPANIPLRTQTAIKIGKFAWNQIQPRRFQLSPNVEDRSWPPVKEAIQNRGRVSEEIATMIRGGKILDLGIFDASKLSNLYNLTLADREDHSVLLNQLLTLEKGVMPFF